MINFQISSLQRIAWISITGKGVVRTSGLIRSFGVLPPLRSTCAHLWCYRYLLLTGHRIFISTPLYTVASPPTLSMTSSSVVVCSYFWATSDTMTASCELQAFGLHSLLLSGLSVPQSVSGRFMMCPWAILCTHSTTLVLTPPLHFLLHYKK